VFIVQFLGGQQAILREKDRVIVELQKRVEELSTGRRRRMRSL